MTLPVSESIDSAASLPSAKLKRTSPSPMSAESSAVAVYITCPAPEFSSIAATETADVIIGEESSVLVTVSVTFLPKLALPAVSIATTVKL